ncbi:MAG: adenosylcobinamide-phosphate synthase CbiB [Oscillatoria princeps RMCB-10]|jgi:adenosylcobinamide-phosphate synthase|nr:adenosylcobinamide-phosphate synthase CbiB [Oscillatoria princeps RMCB-10]
MPSAQFPIAHTVLLLAAFLDYLVGDPWGWPHPVRVMGWAINRCAQLIFKTCDAPRTRRFAGAVLGVGLLAVSGAAGWLIAAVSYRLSPVLGVAAQSLLLASCFAGRSLRAAAEDVLHPLEAGDLPAAKGRLSLYVGRDTENLSESEILRAVLETVSENAVDGVTGPLFYAILGLLVPAVGSVPLALAYKAASTLDSMVGYKDEPFTHLGWFSAKMEDILTWLPCRLTVITLGLISGKLGYVWQMCRRDAIKDPSPNSGWSECACAAILGVQLGGTNYYRGVAKHKPLLGDNINPITPAVIRQALQLNRWCFLIWLGMALAVGCAINYLQ